MFSKLIPDPVKEKENASSSDYMLLLTLFSYWRKRKRIKKIPIFPSASVLEYSVWHIVKKIKEQYLTEAYLISNSHKTTFFQRFLVCLNEKKVWGPLKNVPCEQKLFKRGYFNKHTLLSFSIKTFIRVLICIIWGKMSPFE